LVLKYFNTKNHPLLKASLPLGSAVKELEPVGTAQGDLIALLPAQGGTVILFLKPERNQEIQLGS
jgi:hypothetical protein